MSQLAATRRAVVVGVNTYSGSGFPELRFCAQDAHAFYDALLHYAQYDREHVVLFSDGNHPDARSPLRSDIMSEVRRMCQTAREEDSILLYFAGHGTRDLEDSYLLTREYRSNIKSESGIPMATINDYYTGTRARFRLRLFDACHSGRLGQRGAPNPAVMDHLVVSAEGWATLSACTEEQSAHELPDIGHGLFSYFLVKGLEGAASLDGNVVTLDALKIYTMDNVIKLSGTLGLEQTPVFAGEQIGSLVLATVRSDKPKSEALAKIRTSKPADFQPVATKTPVLLTQLTELFTEQHPSAPFVASSETERTRAIEHAASAALQWLEGATKTPDASPFRLSKTEPSLDKIPLLGTVAEALHRSDASKHLDVTFKFEKVTKYRHETERVVEQVPGLSSIGQFGLGGTVTRTRNVEVPYQAEDLVGCATDPPDLARCGMLELVPQTRLYPHCTMVIVILPAHFGLYLVAYFCSTRLGEHTKEFWSSDSLNMRLVVALPVFKDPAAAQAEMNPRFDDVFAEYISFAKESVAARATMLEKAGAVQHANLAANK